MAKKPLFSPFTLLLIVAVGAVGILTLGRATKPVVSENIEIFIPGGSSYEEVVELLDQAGVEQMGVVNLVGRLKKLDRNPKAGHYILPKGATPLSIVNMLRSGAQKPIRLTFNNIRTLEDLSGRLAEQVEADSLSLLGHLKEPATAAKYNIEPEEVIGLFIPTPTRYGGTPRPRRSPTVWPKSGRSSGTRSAQPSSPAPNSPVWRSSPSPP